MTDAVWVVLPTYDEAENVEAVVAGVRGALAACAQDGFRVLVVDDGSPDGTGAIADRLAGLHPEVEVLHRGRKEGIGRAYIAGFDHALARDPAYVVQMDADRSHDPGDLAALLAAARSGADVVLGSRYVAGGGVRGWGVLRRVVSRAGCWYARAVLGVGVRDLTSGYKCFRAGALRALCPGSVDARGYAFQIELTHRALRLGQRVVEVPIVFRERRVGRSKMTVRIAGEAAWRVPALRRRAARADGAGAAARRAESASSRLATRAAATAARARRGGGRWRWAPCSARDARRTRSAASAWATCRWFRECI